MSLIITPLVNHYSLMVLIITPLVNHYSLMSLIITLLVNHYSLMVLIITLPNRQRMKGRLRGREENMEVEADQEVNYSKNLIQTFNY